MNKWLIVLLLFLLSCVQHTEPSGSIRDRDSGQGETHALIPGIVNEHIRCRADTSYSYALYLPGGYADSAENRKGFPAVIFFDAHKRGVLPVKKYASLGEELGFVLIGSNNSANGQTQAESDRIISLLFEDIQQRLHLDNTRLVVSGFSGGARVAAGIALFRKEDVQGVIGCAAGFPPISLGFNTAFSYLAMVGDKDFNYLELKELDRALDQTPIPHSLLVYAGKHDWPPVEVMRDGFAFLQFDFLRKNQHLKNKNLIDVFRARNDSIRMVARENGNMVLLAETDRKMTVFLEQLIPVESYQQERNNILKTAEYRAWAKKKEKEELFEKNQQQKYAAAMGLNDLNWWLPEIEGLIQSSDDPVSGRLLSYISLISYMYARDAISRNDLKAADKYLTIYQKVDPENPEVYYLRAVWYAGTGDEKKALEQLHEAAVYGFNDIERLTSSKDFSSFNGEEFTIILRQMKNNQIN